MLNLTPRDCQCIRACLRRNINNERNFRRDLKNSFWGDDEILQAASKRYEARLRRTLEKIT